MALGDSHDEPGPAKLSLSDLPDDTSLHDLVYWAKIRWWVERWLRIVAVKNTLRLVREGRRRIIRELEKHDATRANALKDYKEPLADGDYPTRDELLAAEIRKGQELVCDVRKASTSEAVAEVADVYEQILSGGSGVRQPRGP